MKIRSLGTELLLAEGDNETNSSFSQLCERNAE